MATVYVIDKLTVETAIETKKEAFKDTLKAVKFAEQATKDWWLFASKVNPQHPMYAMQDLAFECGLWPSILNKTTQLPEGESYPKVYKEIREAHKEGRASAYDSYKDTCRLLSAIQRAGSTLRAEKKMQEAYQAQLALAAKLNDPTSHEHALAKEIEATEAILSLCKATVEDVLASIGYNNEFIHVQVTPSVANIDKVNDIIEAACNDLENLKTKNAILAAYRETLRKLAVLA